MSYQISLFNAVPQGAVEVIFDGGNNPWFRRADLGRYLGIVDIRHNFKNVTTKSRSKLGGATPLLGRSKNGTDAFVNLDNSLEIVSRSKKPKAVQLIKWLANKGVEKALAELDEIISQNALLNDDLVVTQEALEAGFQEIAILEQDNVELQNQVNELQSRIVPRLDNAANNNGMVIIQKNNGDDYPYLAICGQQGYVAQKIRNKLTDYPNGFIVVLAETPNAIVHYNWLRERRCIKANPDRVRHFRLGENYTHARLMELQEV